jgi:hypothetical protein
VDSVAFVADFPIVGNTTERTNHLRSDVIMSDHRFALHRIALNRRRCRFFQQKLYNLEMTWIINYIIDFDCNEWTSAHTKSNLQIFWCPNPMVLDKQIFRLRNIEISSADDFILQIYLRSFVDIG